MVPLYRCNQPVHHAPSDEDDASALPEHDFEEVKGIEMDLDEQS